MKKIKLLFPIGAFYPSQIGGPCNTLYWHTCELKKNDFDVNVVTTTLGIKQGEVVVNEEIDIECGRVYYGTGSPYNLKTTFKIINQIKSADILHLNSLFDSFSIISFFYTRLFHSEKAIIWSVRGELNPNALKYGLLKKRLLLNIYKLYSNRFIFHSTSNKETEHIQKTFSISKILQIPNFIKPANRLLDIEIKQQILFIGRIHPIKATDKLLIALSLSDAFKKSNFCLKIAGEYEERNKSYFEYLKNLIVNLDLNDRISFIGHVTGEDKELLYAQSYLTILCSETENFGNVILESLNQSTPVIASLGTPWEILESYNCGLHVSNEPSKLAEAINTILSLTENEYNLMRNKCHTLVDDKFNVKNGIFSWITEYKKLYNLNKNKP